MVDLEAIGTNAHELPMVYAALADDDQALARAPYRPRSSVAHGAASAVRSRDW